MRKTVEVTMELAAKSFTGITVEGDGSREGDDREETATEEAAAKKTQASEQANGGSRREKIKKQEWQLGIGRGGG